MPKMTESELMDTTYTLLNEAESYLEERVTEQRAKAMRYYHGENPDNLPEVEGRSKIVVTEVRDTIEWILPDLLKIFTGGEKLISIEPNGEEDSFDAEQAEEWVNYVVNRQNNGFMTAYVWMKDALLNKLGFIKQYWKTETFRERQDYDGLSEEEFEGLKGADGFEIADSEKITFHLMDTPAGPVPMEGEPENMEGVVLDGDGNAALLDMYNVTGYKITEESRIVEENLPPEEVLFLEDTKEIPHKCRFVAHEKEVTVSELRELFPDVDIEDDISGPSLTEAGLYDEETLERNYDSTQTVGLESDQAAFADPASKKVWLYEIYTKTDYDGDGVAEWVQLFRCGDTVLGIDEVDYPKIFTICPILWPHRAVGLSLADILLDLQELQTALNRQILDAVYLANNPRSEIDVNGLTEDTVDDLLDNRIGGYVRVTHPGTVNPLITTPLQPWTFNLLEHWEQRREQRTGVTRYSGGLDPNTLNKTATGVMSIMSAAARRIELIARIFAETGFKDRIKGILDLSAQYPDYVGERVLKLTNKSINLDPERLRGRYDLITSAGIGAGNKEIQTAALMQILQTQKELIVGGMGPGNPKALVTMENLFNTLKAMIQNMGFKATNDFVSDPEDPQIEREPPREEPPDPQVVKAQMDAQQKQAELQQKEDESLRKYEIEKEQNALRAREIQIKEHELGIQAWKTGHEAAVRTVK